MLPIYIYGIVVSVSCVRLSDFRLFFLAPCFSSCCVSSSDYPVLHHLLTVGISSKHGVVRDHCYRGISNTLIRLDPRYVEREKKRDQEELEKENMEDEPDREAEHISASASSSVSDSGTASPCCRPLFSRIASAVQNGITDPFDKARAAARLCLIQLQYLSPIRAERIVAGMNQAQEKVFMKQKAEYESNRALAESETETEKKQKNKSSIEKSISSASSSSLSFSLDRVPSLSTTSVADDLPSHPSDSELEAELNPPSKKQLPQSQSETAFSATSIASSSIKSKIAAQKKAFKRKKKKNQSKARASSPLEHIEVRVPDKSTSGAAPSDEPKVKEKEVKGDLGDGEEEEAVECDSDAADEESTPIGGTKERISDSDETDEEQEKEEASAASLSSPSTPIPGASPPSASTRNHGLLSKLLDLDTPVLTDKMLEFLLNDGVLEVFLGFVVRAENINIEQLAKNDCLQKLEAKSHNADEDTATTEKEAAYSDVPFTPRSRPSSDNASEQTAIRRSYHVMQLLCHQRQSQSLMAVLTPKIPSLTLQLMFVFHPESKGNFYHACTILQKTMATFPGTVLTALCSP